MGKFVEVSTTEGEKDAVIEEDTEICATFNLREHQSAINL